MFNLLSKKCLLVLLALFSLNPMASSLAASEYWEPEYNDSAPSPCCETLAPGYCDAPTFACCETELGNRVYIGAFGGGLYSNSTHMTQMGTAFFPEAFGGPLAVDARGRTRSTSSGFGGVQIGYHLSNCSLNSACCWSIASAVETEAYWYSHRKKGYLLSDTDTVRLAEHDFLDSFHMNVGVYLVNAIFSFNHSFLGAFSPYLGGGIGAARISIKHADSLQVYPLQEGINHFNSRRSDSSWAFAAQAKLGLRYLICGSFHLFGEYRYVFLDSSNYILGSTVYPTLHVPTTPWNVKVHNIHYNAFVFGIQYTL